MAGAATNICNKAWEELHKLRDLPPLQNEKDAYPDYAAFAACNEVRSTFGPCADLPREEFLAVFSRLVEGPRLEELFSLFMASRNHPALQHSCLIALHGVAELSDRREDLLTRQDVAAELIFLMSSPRRQAVTPASAGAAAMEVVNSAAGAVTTITSLFSSNRTLEPKYSRSWVDLGAVSALASSLESHEAFDRATPVTKDLPLCFFLISTSLLAGAADAIAEREKLRLGTAWLRLFVEARRWIAHEAADLLADFYTRPNWLKDIVVQIPEELRARAIEAARLCEREGGSWKRGIADRLALVLRCVNVPCRDEEGSLGRRCAGPGCIRVQKSSSTKGGDIDHLGEGGPAVRFKRCSRCHSVVYCSRECQAAHWKAGHGKACAAALTA